jgi:hypothetical protein
MHFQYIYCISTSTPTCRTCRYTINILKVHLLEVIIYILMKMHGKHSIIFAYLNSNRKDKFVFLLELRLCSWLKVRVIERC